MHCAETKEQAIADVQYGIEHWFRYFQAVAAFPQMAVLADSAAEMIDFINKSGLGVIGTPEECAAQIDRLVKQSNGGASVAIRCSATGRTRRRPPPATSCLTSRDRPSRPLISQWNYCFCPVAVPVVVPSPVVVPVRRT